MNDSAMIIKLNAVLRSRMALWCAKMLRTLEVLDSFEYQDERSKDRVHPGRRFALLIGG
jgi:hypothetical protein